MEKQPKCPLVQTEYGVPIQWNIIPLYKGMKCWCIQHGGTQANWKKPDKKSCSVWFHLYEISRIGKSSEAESRLGRGLEGKSKLMGMEFLLGAMKMFWK